MDYDTFQFLSGFIHAYVGMSFCLLFEAGSKDGKIRRIPYRKKIRFFRFILRREVIFGWRIDTMVTELVEVGRGSDVCVCVGGQILDS